MTCVVAIEHEGKVWMGADRLGSDGHRGEPYAVPKVFKKDGLLIGCCGSYRMMQILQHALEVPKETLTNNIDKWVAIDLVKAMRTAYKANEWDKKDGDEAKGNPILVAIQGRCYEIQSDFSYLRSISGEYAVGSGQDYAKGSLFATRNLAAPRQRIIAALNAASEYIISVGGPYDIQTNKGKN